MWRLLTSFLLIVNTFTQSQAMASKQTVSSPLQKFSPKCVVSALNECEYFGKADSHFITVLKSIMRNLQCNPNQSFKDLSANIKASMVEISKLLFNFDSIPFDEYFKSIANSITEHQDLSIKFANNSSTTENFIQNEIKVIRNEFISLKESCEQNTALEEIKSSIKELKSLMIEERNFSKEILSVIKPPQKCAGVSLNDRVIKVYPYEGNTDLSVEVLCDQTTDGGGWAVIQNRDDIPVRENFNRSWNDYVKGFGDLNGEFWLGLDNVYALTNSTPMELRIDLEDYDGEKTWTKYDLFRIGDASSKYDLTVKNYSGDAGDALSLQNGMKFSTHDQDNDQIPDMNCALSFKGGWWLKSCHDTNLNGFKHVSEPKNSFGGIIWFQPFSGWYYSLKKASMKLRPKSFN